MSGAVEYLFNAMAHEVRARLIGAGALLGGTTGAVVAGGCAAGTGGVCALGAPTIVGAGAAAGAATGGFIANVVDWLDSLTVSAGGKVKGVPDRGVPGSWVDGDRRSRQYGPDGRPSVDIDKPHQGMPEPHVHEWEDGRREHPGRPVSPWPR